MPLTHVNPDNYEQQLADKVSTIRQQFACFNPPEPQVFPSQPLNFRGRAEFRVWHQDDDMFYAMFKKDSPKQPRRIDQFPIGAKRITALMPELRQRILSSDTLRQRLFQVEFLTTLTSQALVTLIYHKALDQEWEQQARHLQQQLDIDIIGRSKKQRLVLSHDYVIETLTVDDQAYQFQQVENSFTQPNALMNQKMLSWALKNSANNGGDLVELYCGNGNFTVVLAQNFNRVLATEISKTSVKSAHYNFKLNHIDNVDVVRMSSEEFTEALQRKREFRRLQAVDLNTFNFSTILVDPPRAGLDSATEQLVSGFDNILYISCNPNTLHSNLKTISKTHRIERFALFDQFPYTNHMECAVSLIKRERAEDRIL